VKAAIRIGCVRIRITVEVPGVDPGRCIYLDDLGVRAERRDGNRPLLPLLAKSGER
jgi:hypothetical protein